MDVAALRQRAAGVGVTVRALRPGDRAAAGEALVACGAFTDEEVRVALEVLDAGVEAGSTGTIRCSPPRRTADSPATCVSAARP